MALTSHDYFITHRVESGFAGTTVTYEDELDRSRLDALMAGPDPAHSDVEVALALIDLVRDDLERSGTDGGQVLSDVDMRIAMRAMERVSERAGHPCKPPFRDHSAWRSWWNRNGAYGSWQARRDLLSDLFDAPSAVLMAVQDRLLDSTLMEAVSPRERLGWPGVDTEVGELRRHFRTAVTPQDYRAVGNDCVHLTEALSRQVYGHAVHGVEGEDEPSVDKTKIRLDRYIDAKLPGKGNAEMRKLARSIIELAQAVKHRGTPTRTEAGTLADAVIALANMLRRLDEEVGTGGG